MENKSWFNKSVEDVEKKLSTNGEKGLTLEEVKKNKQKRKKRINIRGGKKETRRIWL